MKAAHTHAEGIRLGCFGVLKQRLFSEATFSKTYSHNMLTPPPRPPATLDGPSLKAPCVHVCSLKGSLRGLLTPPQAPPTSSLPAIREDTCIEPRTSPKVVLPGFPQTQTLRPGRTPFHLLVWGK